MSQPIFRLATLQDIPFIMEIIDEGRRKLKNQGTDQWQDQKIYPIRQFVTKDIHDGRSFLLEVNGKVAVTLAFIELKPEWMRFIEGGWSYEKQHVYIGRFAIRQQFQGQKLASLIIKYITEQIIKRKPASIRAFIHSSNKVVQYLLEKYQFKCCGTALLPDDIPYKTWIRSLSQFTESD